MKNKLITEVKKIFYIYRKNKIIINNHQYINNSLNGNILEKDLDEYKKYISLVDSILEELDKNDKWILKNIFIDKKEKSELNYSESTFYWRLRKASFNFMELMKW